MQQRSRTVAEDAWLETQFHRVVHILWDVMTNAHDPTTTPDGPEADLEPSEDEGWVAYWKRVYQEETHANVQNRYCLMLYELHNKMNWRTPLRLRRSTSST